MTAHSHPIPRFKKAAFAPWIAKPIIDHMGFLRANGVVFGRRIVSPDGEILLAHKDRNRNRCKDLGRTHVYVSLADLVEVMNG